MVENSLEIPEGWGGYHCYPKMENPKGWGVLYEIPSVVGVWIFSGTTQLIFLNYFFQSIFKIILLIKTKHLYLLAIVSSYMGASDPRSLAGHTNRNRQSCKKFEIFFWWARG